MDAMATRIVTPGEVGVELGRPCPDALGIEDFIQDAYSEFVTWTRRPSRPISTI